MQSPTEVNAEDHAAIVEAIVEIVRHEWPANVPAEGIHPGIKLFYEGLGLDSVDGVTLILSLEEKFDITIEQDEIPMGAFETVGTLAAFVAEQRHARA